MESAATKIHFGRTAALVSVLAAGFFVGEAPLAILLEEPWLLAPMAAIAVFAAFWSTRRLRTDPSIRVRPLEWLIASENAAFWGVVATFGGVVTYAVVYGVTWVIDKTGIVDVSPANASFWAAAFAGLLLALSSFSELRVIAGELLPSEPGQRRPYSEMADSARPVAWWGSAAAALAVPALLAYLLGPFSNWTKAAAGVLIPAISLAALPEESSYQPGTTQEYEETVSEVARAFEDDGYEVVFGPTTGDEHVDSQLSDIDLYAQKENERPLLIDVKLWTDEVEWTVAPDMLAGAVALGTWMSTGDQPVRVRPVLVLVDSHASDSLLRFGTEYEFGFILIDRSRRRHKVEGLSEGLAGVTDRLGEILFTARSGAAI